MLKFITKKGNSNLLLIPALLLLYFSGIGVGIFAQEHNLKSFNEINYKNQSNIYDHLPFLSKPTLESLYKESCETPSDIYEHMPLLLNLAKECSSVTEIGLRNMTSTWGLLKGLAENPNHFCSYLGIDIVSPKKGKIKLAKKLSKKNRISFQFLEENDMNLDINNTDLLFIDSLHTYCHLTYELEKFSPKVRKYIALHDTSFPWGNINDYEYKGNYSEYPSNIDRNKKGLWPAVEDFLERHPEWVLQKRYLNCHGFTILKRIK
jgi:hypothetical protein